MLASAKGFVAMVGKDRSIRIGIYRRQAALFAVLADGIVNGHFAGEGVTMQRIPMLREDTGKGGGRRKEPKNVLGDRLEVCSLSPMTGFFRDGCCDTSREDIGSHTVCVLMTLGFLEFSKSCGNDLSTPVPEFGFPGLKPGDRWCLCAPRCQEARQAVRAPHVGLLATHDGELRYCSLEH